MRGRKEKFERGKITILWWFCGFLLAYLVYWLVMVNFVVRDFWDTQYQLKPALLQKRVAENPGHSLWLIFGSSRVEDGLRPGLLVERMRKEGAPLVFNFGLSGSDLFRELIYLRRLLEDGVKPQRVGIEILAPLLHHVAPLNMDDPRMFIRARRDEVDLYASYSSQPDHLKKLWLRSRIDPNYEFGMVVPGETRVTRLLPVPWIWSIGEPHPYDNWGWWGGVGAEGSREEYKKKLEVCRTQFKEWFEAPDITPNSERALRQILDLCKSAGVDAFLLRMPESVDYQAFYPPDASLKMDAWLQQMGQEYTVPVVDARSWVETEGFADGQHLNNAGAEKFTRRLGDEIFDRLSLKNSH